MSTMAGPGGGGARALSTLTRETGRLKRGGGATTGRGDPRNTPPKAGRGTAHAAGGARGPAATAAGDPAAARGPAAAAAGAEGGAAAEGRARARAGARATAAVIATAAAGVCPGPGVVEGGGQGVETEPFSVPNPNKPILFSSAPESWLEPVSYHHLAGV